MHLPFKGQRPHRIETIQLICFENQLNGSYMIATLAFHGLTLLTVKYQGLRLWFTGISRAPLTWPRFWFITRLKSEQSAPFISSKPTGGGIMIGIGGHLKAPNLKERLLGVGMSSSKYKLGYNLSAPCCFKAITWRCWSLNRNFVLLVLFNNISGTGSIEVMG